MREFGGLSQDRQIERRGREAEPCVRYEMKWKGKKPLSLYVQVLLLDGCSRHVYSILCMFIFGCLYALDWSFFVFFFPPLSPWFPFASRSCHNFRRISL